MSKLQLNQSDDEGLRKAEMDTAQDILIAQAETNNEERKNQVNPSGQITLLVRENLLKDSKLGEELKALPETYGENDITIEIIQKHKRLHSFIEIRPGEFFINGVILDAWTMGAMLTVYDAINETNKTKFRNTITTAAGLALMIEKCWEWVK